MNRIFTLAALALPVALTGLIGCAENASAVKESLGSWYDHEPRYSKAYDPQADDLANFELAKAKAQAEGENVLLIIGGDWCRWCKVMDLFLTENEELSDHLTDSFVVQKVYTGPIAQENRLLESLPRVAGAPHFFVLAPTGELLISFNTGLLEDGGTYSKEKFAQFINDNDRS